MKPNATRSSTGPARPSKLERGRRIGASCGQLEHHQPDHAISIKPQNNTTNHTLDGPALTLTGVPVHRANGEVALLADFGLGHFDLGKPRSYGMES